MTQSPLRIAINGFGRIGRLTLRALIESERHNEFEIVAINDLSPYDTMAHLFEFDSVHGKFSGSVCLDNNILHIDYKNQKHAIPLYNIKDPSSLPWAAHNVDIVWECSGAFASREAAHRHIDAGAQRVLISAPGKDVDLTTVFGVNDHLISKEHIIISNASCTTNCLSPMAKVLDDVCGIAQGFMTTIHAYTGDQQLIDTHHKDLHRARAAALSMIPTSTGAAKAVGLVLPHLAGRIDGTAIRVPTPNVSAVDFTFTAKSETDVTALREAFIAAASGPLNGVLATTDQPLVSIDFNHHPASSVVALNEIQVVNGTFVRVLSWYDNEWGFANRMLDTSMKIKDTILEGSV